MDKHGYWHNEHGKFQHKKIIDYFHSCIEKDADGFYLNQERDNYKEKVYFPYEETAYFVFNVSKKNDDVTLTLNTKKQIELNPENLLPICPLFNLPPFIPSPDSKPQPGNRINCIR